MSNPLDDLPERIDAPPAVRDLRTRRAITCSHCKELGHKRPKCPKLRPTTAPVADPIERAAQIRERLDALKIEREQYREAQRQIDRNLSDNLLEAAKLEDELRAVRGVKVGAFLP